ncbi:MULTISPECIES: TetR/AcrR family transcriptional regulator [Butyrivibrio]|uniref:TetR/AcrR family transcriptional regulator n=1 Tax=Butyrivibrio TaxID=830 RepID=UPI000429F847|nr:MULTISPECIES: TetR/AcrR family transcriptional regulator [Butyrivibrio]SEQ48552.1 transcriptional regulator, TetR family [Butyrivibrio sp. TB]
MNEQDVRYSTAEEAIIDSFFLLLKEKDYDKISVSDVVKKSGIVRSTFYNHYENVTKLISAAEDKTIDDIFRLMESFHPQNDHELCRSYFLAICNYTRDNLFLAGLFKSPRGNSFLEKAMTMFHRYVSGTGKEGSAVPKSREHFTFLIAGTIGFTIGILHKWTAENFESPAEDVADILAQTFLKGVLPYLWD